MVDNSKMNNEHSGRDGDPMEITEGDQWPRNNQGASNQERADNPIQPAQSLPTEKENRGTPSIDWDAWDPSQASVMEKPMSPQKNDPHEMPSAYKSVNEAEIPWFSREEINELHSRWNTIQVQFIDDPCSSVEQGEALVAETVERMKQMIADQ